MPSVIKISVTWVQPITCGSSQAAMAFMAVAPFGKGRRRSATSLAMPSSFNTFMK